jgi:two-component system, NarL family, invasion response regulator UvrY
MTSEIKEYKIAIVEDQELVRIALADLVNHFDGYKVVIEASSGEKLMEIIENEPLPDLILMDLNMPGMGGKETAFQLLRKYPHIRILMLSTYATELVMGQLVVAGVKGFLAKDSKPRDFRNAIRIIVEMDLPYTANQTSRLLRKVRGQQKNDEIEGMEKDNNKKGAKKNDKKNKGKPAKEDLYLTDEELLFLQCICTDLTYNGIAGVMKLKNGRAADAIRERLFGKLDVKSRSGLVMFAIRNGIINF